MRRGLGLDFGRQALLCFAAVTLTHWFVNLLSYVRSLALAHECTRC
jgi:hypothetical protein